MVPVLTLLIVGAIVLVAFKFPNIMQGMFLPAGLGLEQFDKLSPGDCTLSLSKVNLCVGEEFRASVRDGKNADCIAAYNYNNLGWVFAQTFSTDANGYFSASPIAGDAGLYEFAAICIENERTLCRTNDVDMVVRFCPTDDDSDGDGYTDEEEAAADTDPNDPYDHPSEESDGISYTCGQGTDVNSCYGTCPTSYECYTIESDTATWCACIDGIAVHPDWKPEGDYYNPVESEETIEPLCYDSDGANIFNVGFVTYSGVTHYDTCHAGTSSYAVEEWVCIDDVAVEKEIYCPYSDCVNGKCMSGTTSVYNQCLILGYTDGGYCSSSSDANPGCVLMPSLDTVCGDLYPLNPAKCCN